MCILDGRFGQHLILIGYLRVSNFFIRNGGIIMLNINNIENLIVEEEDSFLNDVIEDDTGICQMSSAETELSNICDVCELNELNRFLTERGIAFWLISEPKVNPNKKYFIWISRTRGNHPHWGPTPIDKDEPQQHERKHRS